jgi:hypothetical protein
MQGKSQHKSIIDKWIVYMLSIPAIGRRSNRPDSGTTERQGFQAFTAFMVLVAHSLAVNKRNII